MWISVFIKKNSWKKAEKMDRISTISGENVDKLVLRILWISMCISGKRNFFG